MQCHGKCQAQQTAGAGAGRPVSASPDQRRQDLILKAGFGVNDSTIREIAVEEPNPSRAFKRALMETGTNRRATRCRWLALLKRDFPEDFAALIGE